MWTKTTPIKIDLSKIYMFKGSAFTIPLKFRLKPLKVTLALSAANICLIEFFCKDTQILWEEYMSDSIVGKGVPKNTLTEYVPEELALEI